MKIELCATCLFGLEHLLGEEIDALGYRRTETIDGRVYFTGDENAVTRANIFLRYAERVFICLGRFPADSFDALFEGCRALPFEAFIGKNDAFPVKGHSIKSKLTSIPDCQRIVKKAIATRLGECYGIEWFPEEGVPYQVEFFILKDVAALMIDTSGTPLHKRGYRAMSNLAPLRETLAAACAAISRPREDVVLLDPMCGSGTIAIEAAMLMRNIAPGRSRSFAAEQFPFIPRSLWDETRDEAFDMEKESAIRILASDIDPACVELAAHNARLAGVEESITVEERDVRTLTRGDFRGTVVTNPPYGERLMTRSEVDAFYREIGPLFRSLAPWQIYVLTSHPDFSRFYGRRADKVRKLYNGMIPCYLHQFYRTR